MGEPQQLELKVVENDHKQAVQPPLDHWPTEESTSRPTRKTTTRTHWVRISAYAISLVVGQSVATLLGRLYFVKGGSSKWLEALVQLAGFPLLIPLYYILPLGNSNNKSNSKNPTAANQTPLLKLGLIYITLGLLMAANTVFYSIGLQYLPVSTYSLICASQLAFNALFSFFLNGQSFTPYIINSLVLLTISSVLLVFQKTDGGSGSSVTRGKYALGFVMTLVASAGYALVLSLGQLVFQKVLRVRSFKFILDLVVYESLVASLVVMGGLFASGEWHRLGAEMGGFELGRASYVMTLFWTALLWQVYAVGTVGLIFEVSALFSNVISTLALPVTPVLAVVFLGDKMDGVKGVAMALAVWGFVSYAYQQYVDEFKGRGGNSEGVDSHVINITR